MRFGFIFFLSLLFVPAVAFARDWAPSKVWIKTTIPGVEKAWTKALNPDLVLTLNRDSSLKSNGFGSDTPDEVAVGITGYRRATLSEFGFKEWAITNLKLEEHGTVVKIDGEFIDPGQRRVQFVEWMLFKKGAFHQLSLQSKRALTPAERKEIAELFATYSP